MLGLRVEVFSIPLRGDFFFSFALVVLSEGSSSVAFDDAVSPGSIDGRAPIDLALRIAFGERFALEGPYEVAAEAACKRAEGFLFGEPVPPADGEATSPGLAVAPAVPVTSVPAATCVRGPGLTP